MRALKPEEDALDKVFNNLETFACHEDKVDLRDSRIPGARFETKMVKKNKDIIDNVFESVEKVMCRDDTNVSVHGRNNYAAGTTKKTPALSTSRGGDPSGDNNALVAYERDILDNVFEEVEKVACRYQNNGRLASSQKDLLDNFFEEVEKVSCRDDYEEGRIQRGHDPPAHSSSRSSRSATAKKSKGVITTARDNADMLDRVCENFEHTACQDPNSVAYLNDPDLLDHVCENIENKACGSDQSRNSSGASTGGGAQAPIDLTSCATYSLENNNSMVQESPSVDAWSEKGVIGLERRAAIEGSRVSSSSSSSSTRKKSHPKQLMKVEQKHDMLDYVFENVESGVCRPDDQEEHQTGLSRVEKVRADQEEHQTVLSRVEKVRAEHKESRRAEHKESASRRFSKARAMRRVYNEETQSQKRVYWKDHE
jgi:hypothetical protein